jgi:hypothetical protein
MSPDTHKEWAETYGNTFRFHGFGRVRKSVFDLFQCLTSNRRTISMTIV